MDQHWSMKKLHRLIVTSSTYRMQSWTADQAASNLAKDPGNQYLWRMNPQRMQAEVVRDSMLQMAGLLDLTMGGPEIDDAKGEESRRRSIYFHQTPDNQMVLLQVFDGPSSIECYERSETVTPQQALALANSKLSFTVAERILGRLGGESSPTAAFVGNAFADVLGRPPTAPEFTLSQKFLEREEERFRDPAKSAWQGSDAGSTPSPVLRARQDLVHALLNHNDFVTIR